MVAKNLTARFIESVSVDARTDYQDSNVRGLNFRVSSNGNKSWSVVYRRKSDGRKRRLTIGQFPIIGLENARSRALQVMSKVAEGLDPASKTQIDRKAMTVEQLGKLFIEKYAKKTKRTWAANEQMFEAEVYPRIGAMKVHMVTRRDILDLIEVKTDAGVFAQARAVLAIVRKLFNWAVHEQYVDSSPVIAIKSPGNIVRRDRVLSDVEIGVIWNGLPEASIAAQTADIIRLLFLTGQRSGEVCGMVFNEIHATNWILPADRTKNGLAHVVPLSEAALEIIRSALEHTDEGVNAPLFAHTRHPISSQAISQAVRKRLQLFDERWTPHDIRRTVATGMAGLGIQPHIVEACLNHISGFRAGVAGIYNRNQYEDEKRRALNVWEAHLMALVEGEECNVVPLQRETGNE